MNESVVDYIKRRCRENAEELASNPELERERNERFARGDAVVEKAEAAMRAPKLTKQRVGAGKTVHFATDDQI